MKLFNRLAGTFAITTSLSCLNLSSYPTWPGALHDSTKASSTVSAGDEDLVQSLPVCIASPSWSAGQLGPSVLYRYEREGRRMRVGYFVYWTTERPWGPNFLSYSVLPALFIDAFYSHLFFLFPGAQRLLHGPGDIEGARIVYEQNDEGRWIPVSGVADNESHHEVRLSPEDFIDGDGRVVLTTSVWSHQLGTRSVHQPTGGDTSKSVCFGGASLAPLTGEIAR